MRRVLLASGVVLLAACGSTSHPCKGNACLDASVVDAGLACGGSCATWRPVCNRATGYCVICTATEGCSGALPVCDVTANAGAGACIVCDATHGCGNATPACLMDTPRRCVECLTPADCPWGPCDPVQHICLGHVDGGVDAGLDGGTDGGQHGSDGGSRDAGSDGGSDGGLDGGLDGGRCITRPPPMPCTMECDRGFSCQHGACVLNGAQGPVQVTLRWNTAEDVDLHVLEPVPGGAPCDVYYGNTTGSSCGALGMLDLDSNAGCSIDNVDIENVIYDPDAGVTPGLYEVRVDHWSNCNPSTRSVPFEVEVRNNGVITGMCGVFTPSTPGWNNHGSANSGTTVMTFIVP